MRVAGGKLVNGKVVTEGIAFEHGTAVTVIAADAAETFELGPEDETAMSQLSSKPNEAIWLTGPSFLPGWAVTIEKVASRPCRTVGCRRQAVAPDWWQANGGSDLLEAGRTSWRPFVQEAGLSPLLFLCEVPVFGKSQGNYPLETPQTES